MTLKTRTLIFAVIGVVNTAIDIVLFLVLEKIGLPIVVANTISTGVALLFSYIFNRRFTFNDRLSNKTTIVRFFVVTLLGLWILQPLIIYGVIAVIHHTLLAQTVFATYDVAIAKLAATGASMVWNFVLYDKFVFKK